MNILLVSESFIVKDALLNLFKSTIEDANVSTISDLGELKCSSMDEIDFIFTDINRGQRDQMGLISDIKDIYKDIKIMILDNTKNKDIFIKAVKSGVDGYILEMDDKDEFIYSIKKILKGRKVYDTELLPQILDDGLANEIEVLTIREREVLELVSEGLNNKQIASSLHITEYTVKKHLGSIFNKLNLKNRKDVIIYVKDNYRTLGVNHYA